MTIDPDTLVEGAGDYALRASIGNRAISLAGGGLVTNEDDRETYASDAISDILTALFGPAGTSSFELGVRLDAEALDKAQSLLDHALFSYKGDAEDYTA